MNIDFSQFSYADLAFLEDLVLFTVIMDSDSYKTSHWVQYPKGTTKVVSYLESRGGQFDETIQYGFQYHLQKYFCGVKVTHAMIDAAKIMIVAHMGGIPEYFNEAGWRHIADFCGGKLPLSISILPEGYRVKKHNALAVVTNTDPNCAWLVNYVETPLLRVWYPISVATLSYELRKLSAEYLELSGTMAKLDFMVQDFGSRGVSCTEEAQIGGSAHSMVFKGSDTMILMPFLIRYYGSKACSVFSVPASEHSTMTSWGLTIEAETDAVENMLDSYPTGIVSIVADSRNVFEFCSEILGKRLRQKVLARAGKGTIVVRPDSSDGVKYTIEGIFIKLLEILGDAFGYEVNSKGYKVLPDFLRVLQGDGMNYHSVRALFRAITDAGWSIDNVACIGMGGKLLRSVDRDTHKFAFKCCAVLINGEWKEGKIVGGVWREVFKDPITDPGKQSKRGIPYVTYHPVDGFKTSTHLNEDPVFGNRLVEVFRNGDMLVLTNVDEIKANIVKDNYAKKVIGAAYLRETE